MYVCIFRIALLTGICLALQSCNDPLENVSEYDLTINNRTDTTYTVYEATTELSGGSFRNVDTIEPMGSITRQRLIVNIEYTFRLVAGDDPEQYDFQQIIESSGNDITWSIP